MPSNQRVLQIAVFVVLLVLIVVPFQGVDAGTFTVFGLKDYARTAGKPTTETDIFSVFNPNTAYTIHVYNGGNLGQFEQRGCIAVIRLNGVLIVEPKDFGQKIDIIERSVTLGRENEVSVELRGAPGSGITVEIIGVDNEPPQISADVIPPPNEHGWNNTDVTIEFNCSDTISGIASCTDPVLIQTEGSSQVVSGTAIDYAGNTTSTSVSINLDKTPPQISADIIPLPNEHGWNNTDVTVEFDCLDTMSGIASCSDPVLVQTEGPSQMVPGTAIDYAGNKASTSVSINLDRMPPQISADVIPTPNAYGWHNTDVTVEFSCSDTMSDIASCTGPVLVQTEDSAQVISGTAIDRAGNTASTSVSINLDKTPPLVYIKSPVGLWGWPRLVLEGTVTDTLSGNHLLFLNGDPLSWSNEDTLSWKPDSFFTDIDTADRPWGSDTLYVSATDLAGNSGSSRAIFTYWPILPPDTVAFESVKKFAPQLRFSSAHWTDSWSNPNFPMSAQVFYDEIVANGNPDVRFFNGNHPSDQDPPAPTYWRAWRCGWQVRIIYAWFYGYQFRGSAGISEGEHHGDWEHIMVTLSEDESCVAAVTYWQHKGWYTRIRAQGGLQLYQDTHPIVYVGRCQHGSYHYMWTTSQTDCYWDDHRDGQGGWWSTWEKGGATLIELKEGNEPWMAEDLIGGFRWGYSGVSTHPMTAYTPTCGIRSCYGDPINLCTVGKAGGCGHSHCQATDRDMTWTCWHCAPGWVDWGAFCVRKCSWYPFCSSHSIKVYDIDWPIPTGDAGLLYKAGW